MNNEHGITIENLLLFFPPALAVDKGILALATGVAELLAQRVEEIRKLQIYTRIDELPEELLDVLAYDFKVDWYDPDYTLEEKRQTLKDNWRVHRILGTKAAVETAISAIYPDTQVLEWWEYSGDPYHFKLLIDSSFEHIDPVKHQRVLEKVNCYKPLRSVLDEVEYYDAGATASAYACATLAGETIWDGATAVVY